MNLLDLGVILVLGLYVLLGLYRGFFQSAMSIAADVVSWACGMIFMSPLAHAVTGNPGTFNMLLYYTEGSEFIGDVELARQATDTFSSTQLDSVISGASLPYPFAKEILENIRRQSFASQNITTLGDYFNQTIVCVVINILVFLFIFAIVRVILGFLINGVDYALELPKLKQYDKTISCGCGLLRGILALFVLFMVVPIILIAMNFDFLHNLLDGSLFAPFFYHASFLLGMMPGM